MDSNPPPNIPDHELLRRIGRGSYGEVWLARSITEAYRAVKLIYRDSFDSEKPYEREFAGVKKFEPFSRVSETQVDILHVGRNDAERFFYYVMELADDQRTGSQIDPNNYTPRTLTSEIHQQGRLPLHECLDIAVQLTAALVDLHGNDLVHRDIKPSNIVFINGTPKLTDVGLVTSLDGTKSFVGTEGYIPFEGPGTPQADIYALGKVLYQISTGRDRLAFPELPTDLKDHPERLALLRLNQVLLKACHEDRKRRYQSAKDLLSDLERLKTGPPASRTRPTLKSKVLAGVVVLITVCVTASMRVNHTLKGIAAPTNITPTNPVAIGPEPLLDVVSKSSLRQDSALAEFNRGVSYEQGKGVPRNIKEAEKCYRIAAEKNYAPAEYNLSCLYERGDVTPQDDSEVLKWLQRAADQQLPEAQYNVGVCYAKAKHHLIQNDKEAAKWYRKAAEQGYAYAQYSLGSSYVRGLGVPQDYNEASKWYRKAAEQGDAEAQSDLGACYGKGLGVAQDYKEAFNWYVKSAKQGYAIAEYNLGNYYYWGHGVEQDFSEAVNWFRKAAEQGNVDAQGNLGGCYANGQGVTMDIDEAVKWFRLAARQGDEFAKKNLIKFGISE